MTGDNEEMAALTSSDFREAMSRVAASVHVVTTDGAHGRLGLTVSAVTSVSDTPATVLICLNKRSPVNTAVKANGVFCINALSAADQDLANAFAGRGAAYDMADRFALAEWHTMTTPAPVLDRALVALDCRVSEIAEASTHSVIFGEVVAVRLGDRDSALVYVNRAYHAV